jgi:hypothetical protein
MDAIFANFAWLKAAIVVERKLSMRDVGNLRSELRGKAFAAVVAKTHLFAHRRGLDARNGINSACTADRADFQLAGAIRYTRVDGRWVAMGSA